MMKNVFYFTLAALFLLKIFKTSQQGKQTLAITHIAQYMFRLLGETLILFLSLRVIDGVKRKRDLRKKNRSSNGAWKGYLKTWNG